MAPKAKSSASPADRPPAEQVARENYEREFGTSKPDATAPSAEAALELDNDKVGAPANETKES